MIGRTHILTSAVRPVADISAVPVIVLMALGVLVALAGHGLGSRPLVAFGIVLLFAGTGWMVAGGYASFQSGHPDCRSVNAPAVPC